MGQSTGLATSEVPYRDAEIESMAPPQADTENKQRHIGRTCHTNHTHELHSSRLRRRFLTL